MTSVTNSGIMFGAHYQISAENVGMEAINEYMTLQLLAQRPSCLFLLDTYI